MGQATRAYGDVIRSRRYFPLWLGQLISDVGDTLHYIALVVLVFQLTGRGMAVAGLVAAEIIPVLTTEKQRLAANSVSWSTGRFVQIVLAERHLHLPAAGFAWLIGSIGVGALFGPLIPNTLATDYRDARWLFVPYVIRGIGDILLAVVIQLPLALVILFAYGLNTSTGIVVFNSTIQGAIPDAIRGRTFTLLDISWNAAIRELACTSQQRENPVDRSTGFCFEYASREVEIPAVGLQTYDCYESTHRGPNNSF